MLVFVGVAQKYQYHIGTIFSHTQPVERMLRLYLLWSFYTQVNHQRNFESPKNWESQKQWVFMKLPIFPPLWMVIPGKTRGMGAKLAGWRGRKLSWLMLSGSTSIHRASTSPSTPFWSSTPATRRKGVVLCRFFTPRKGENKRNDAIWHGCDNGQWSLEKGQWIQWTTANGF